MTGRSVGRTLSVLATSVAMLGVAPSPACGFHEATLHVEAGAWFPSLDAEARSSGAGLTGDRITEGDLSIDDPDVVLQGAITFRLVKRHTLRVEGFGFGVDGDGQTSRTFTFDGRTYPVSTRVTSEADVAVFGADYGFDLVHNEAVSFGLTLGARFLSAEASIRAPTLGLEGTGELQAPMPGVGLRVVLHPFPVPPFASLAAAARLVGGTIGDRGSFIDADAGLEWLPIPLLAIRIGYRYFHGRGEEGQEEAEVDLMGPYASLTLAF
jgi:hypothetical protein